MRRVAAFGAVLAVFFVGLAGGVAGAHLFYAHKLEETSERVPYLAPHYPGRLDRSLDLTPEQEREVHRILRQAHEDADELRREVRPRIRELMERAHDEIRETLTPEQRERFDELPLHKLRWRGSEPHRHGERGKHRRHSDVYREGPGPGPAPDRPPDQSPDSQPPASSQDHELR